MAPFVPVLPDIGPLDISEGTCIVYREIVLRNCRLIAHDQSTVYDPSNTDKVNTKHVIHVESYIHKDILSDLYDSLPGAGCTFGTEHSARDNRERGGSTGGGFVFDNDQSSFSPAQMAAFLQKHLLWPRGDFFYYSNQLLVMKALGLYPTGGAPGYQQPLDKQFWVTEGNNGEPMENFDVKNGPRPIKCVIDWVAGYQSFRLNFAIELNVTQCPTQEDENYSWPLGTGEPEYRKTHQYEGDTFETGITDAVLSNRYSISEVRGADFMMTRITSGTLIVRSYSQFATAFRHLCVPAMSKGFQRVKMEFMQSPDGLSLSYTIVDKQRYAAPPSPAIDWKANHSESVADYGYRGTATVTVWLKGAPETPKALLFMSALCIIEHRLGFVWLNNDGQLKEKNQTVPVSLEMVDTLHENELQVSLTVFRTMGVEGEDGTQAYGSFLIGVLGKLSAVHCNERDEVQDEDNNTERDENEVSYNDQTGSPEENPKYKSQFNRGHWPTPLAYDSSTPVGMMAAYFQEPCIPRHAIPLSNVKGAIDPTTTFKERDYRSYDADEPELPPTTSTDSQPKISTWRGEKNAKYAAYDTNFPKPLSPDHEGEQSEPQISDPHKEFPYSHYEIESKYSSSQGIQSVPISGLPSEAITTLPSGISPGAICFARLHQPITHRTVYVKSSRYGELPKIPSAQQTLNMDDPNEISEALVESQIIPSAPILTTNGRMYEHTIEAYYKYALARAPSADEKLRAGSLPWDKTDQSDPVNKYHNTIKFNEVSPGASEDDIV